MLRQLLMFFRPLRVIASELTVIRQLLELELASRDPPIVRITESPRADDTTVSYQGIEDRRPKHKRWEPVEGEEMDDVEQQ